MTALAMVAGKSLTAHLLQKLIFRSGILCYHCWYWHWNSKVSPYNIWEVFGSHVGEIWTKSYSSNHTKFCGFRQKMVNHFWKSIDAILEDVSVTETIIWWKTINLKTTIFQCSKNYGSSTRLTRLKVEPNMVDLDPVLTKRERSLKSRKTCQVYRLLLKCLLEEVIIRCVFPRHFFFFFFLSFFFFFFLFCYYCCFDERATDGKENRWLNARVS